MDLGSPGKECSLGAGKKSLDKPSISGVGSVDSLLIQLPAAGHIQKVDLGGIIRAPVMWTQKNVLFHSKRFKARQN